MGTLPAAFYRRPVLDVARDLLGAFLVRQIDGHRLVGRITETEAYDGLCDRACHAFGGRRTARTDPLFAPGGIAYVYFIYGMYYCLNAVTGEENAPAAVLIRAVEVIQGKNIAAHNRFGLPYDRLPPAKRKNLTNGPGKLCQAFAIDTALNRESLQGNQLSIVNRIDAVTKKNSPIHASPRVGIDYAGEAAHFPWRFTIE